MKTCPKCHTDNPDDVKFCGECGTRLPERTTGTSTPSVSVGDKNVIAGDLIGHQELYRISGNATIVKNEDETKKVVKCHCCGRNLSVAETYDCPECGLVTCPDCYDREHGLCSICFSKREGSKENVFRQTVARILEDGRVDLVERRDLTTLRNQLGLSRERAEQIEHEMKIERMSGISHSSGDSPLSTFERISFEKARSAYHDSVDPQKALDLLHPILQKHKLNEEVLSLYLYSLAKVDGDRAKREIAALEADILAAKLALVDIQMKNGELTEAEATLASAERIWPGNTLLEARRILFLLRLSEETGIGSFSSEARGRAAKLPTKGEMEPASWVFRARTAVAELSGNSGPSLSKAECKERGLSYAIISGILDRPFRIYVVEIRGVAGFFASETLPVGSKNQWEEAAGCEFPEAIRRFGSGDWKADNIPEAFRMPFSPGNPGELPGQRVGVFLDLPDNHDIAVSVVVFDGRGKRQELSQQTIRSLYFIEKPEPLFAPGPGKGILAVVVRDAGGLLTFKIKTDRVFDPTQLRLHVRTIPVIGNRRRKHGIKIIDSVSFHDIVGTLSENTRISNSTIENSFWWTEDSDLDGETKSANEFMAKHPKVRESVERWTNALSALPPESILDKWKADEEPETRSSKKKSKKESSKETKCTGGNSVFSLLESEIDSAFLLQAAAEGDLRALKAACRAAYLVQAFKDTASIETKELPFSPASAWNGTECGPLLRKAALRGDPEAQFVLGWWLEQDGDMSEAAEWFRDVADNPGELNASARAYATARISGKVDAVEACLFSVKTWVSATNGQGAFSGFPALGWGGRFDIKSVPGTIRRIYRWGGISRKDIGEFVLQNARADLSRLVENEQSSTEANRALGMVERELANLSDGRRRIDLLLSAEKRGNGEAKNALPAALFEYGENRADIGSWEEALPLFVEAKERGWETGTRIPEAETAIGDDRLEPNPEEALEWYLRAKTHGALDGITTKIAEAERLVGKQMLESAGDPSLVGKDGERRIVPKKERGLSLLVASAGKGNSDAMMDLYRCFKSGRGVAVDKGEAKKWLKQAIAEKNPAALKIASRPKRFFIRSMKFVLHTLFVLLVLAGIALVGLAFWMHPYWSLAVLGFVLIGVGGGIVAAERHHRLGIFIVVVGGMSFAVPILRYPVKLAIAHPYLAGIPLGILATIMLVVLIGGILANIDK